MYTLFDSHCHFDAPAFEGQRQKLWQQCQNKNITQLCIPGTSPEQSQQALNLAQHYPGIVCAAGLHPWWVDSYQGGPEQLRSVLLPLLKEAQCVAVGECGLDALKKTPLARQQLFFEQQIQLAKEQQLPLIIHSVKTHSQVLALIKQYQPDKGGVIHGFSGSAQQAQDFWRQGFYLGVGSVITYERAQKTRHAVSQLPLEALLLESDAPDMPLSKRRGEDNSPLYLNETAQYLAELKNISLQEVIKNCTHNANTLYQLSDAQLSSHQSLPDQLPPL